MTSKKIAATALACIIAACLLFLVWQHVSISKRVTPSDNSFKSEARKVGEAREPVGMPSVASAPTPNIPSTLQNIAFNGNWTKDKVHLEKKFQNEKVRILAEYKSVPVSEVLKRAESGDLDAALLASEILGMCTSVTPPSSEPYCLHNSNDLTYRRVQHLVAISKARPSLDQMPLLLAASELSAYGEKNDKNADITRQALDALHQSAGQGNHSALAALAITYWNGTISQVNSTYSMAFASIASIGDFESKNSHLENIVASAARPGDFIAATEYVRQIRAGNIRPLYK